MRERQARLAHADGRPDRLRPAGLDQRNPQREQLPVPRRPGDPAAGRARPTEQRAHHRPDDHCHVPGPQRPGRRRQPRLRLARDLELHRDERRSVPGPAGGRLPERKREHPPDSFRLNGRRRFERGRFLDRPARAAGREPADDDVRRHDRQRLRARPRQRCGAGRRLCHGHGFLPRGLDADQGAAALRRPPGAERRPARLGQQRRRLLHQRRPLPHPPRLRRQLLAREPRQPDHVGGDPADRHRHPDSAARDELERRRREPGQQPESGHPDRDHRHAARERLGHLRDRLRDRRSCRLDRHGRLPLLLEPGRLQRRHDLHRRHLGRQRQDARRKQRRQVRPGPHHGGGRHLLARRLHRHRDQR